METEYTQGTWYLNDNDGKIYSDKTINREICSIPSDNAADMANAQLITAAPDLLEALQALLQSCETECATKGMWTSEDTRQEVQDVFAAIKKATVDNF